MPEQRYEFILDFKAGESGPNLGLSLILGGSHAPRINHIGTKAEAKAIVQTMKVGGYVLDDARWRPSNDLEPAPDDLDESA